MELNSKNIKKILLIIFLGVLIYTAFQNLGIIWAGIIRLLEIFSPIIAALCIAFVLNILMTLLETKVFKFWDKAKKKWLLRLKRPVCLILTYLLALGVLSLFIFVIIPDVIDTITGLAEKMPAFVIEVRSWAEGLLQKFNIEQQLPDVKINWQAAASFVIDWISGSSGKIVNSAVSITTSVFSGIFDTLFSIVISIYILASKEKIGGFTKKALNAFFPTKFTGFVYHISTKANDSFSRFISGQLTEALILGILCFIGMTVFRFPNALVISTLISLTALIPIVGAAIGLVIGFLLIVITNPLQAVFFVIFFLILQQLEGNLIYPKVVGKAVGLPGLLVVSAVMIGGSIGGIFGTLISVPVVAVLFSLLKEFVEFSNLKENRVYLPDSEE